MTTEEFRAACTAMGAKNPTAAARMLGLSRAAGWLIWRGDRNVTARTEKRLLQAKKALVRALSPEEMRAMAGCKRAGDQLQRPAPRTNYEAGYDWDGVFTRLVRDGLAERRKVQHGIRPYTFEFRVTPKGMRALKFYREVARADA